MNTPLTNELFPKPQRIETFPGSFQIPSPLPFDIKEKSFEIIKEHLFKKGYFQDQAAEENALLICKEKLPKEEAYRLQIKTNQIILSADKPVGIFRGLQTLDQLVKNSKNENRLPCLLIEDFPLLERRGFMLDVSRCKVPTMSSIFSLIDLLAQLHVNEFQLYIEHTYAFREHKTIWENSSPLTPQEIQQIDHYCSERFIELVPNLNSFGHFERWLCHDDYKHLAECPDGFRREEPYMVRDHGSTLKPNQASLDFIDSLYAEYLPNFSSKKFNVGMDEPWELGQGWSKNQVREKGKDKVYLAHLEGIRKLVESHGKEMQFWADVLLENPENAKLLPPSASPIIWGYEPNHPFPEQAHIISSCDLSYCIAPGTGTWRSFSGRWPNTRANIDAAITNAKKFRAEGILLTSWGDCGNHQPWATLYPPLLYGAAQSWNNQPIHDTALITGMDWHLFNGIRNTPSASLIELGKLDQLLNSNIENNSLCWFILFASQPEKTFQHLKEKHSIQQFEQALAYLASIDESISTYNHQSPDCLVGSEIKLGVKLSTIALQKGIALLSDKTVSPMPPQNQIFSDYQSIWLRRARKGGLHESIDILSKAIC